MSGIKTTTCDEIYEGISDGQDITGWFVSDAHEHNMLGQEIEDWDGNVVEIDERGYVKDSRMWGMW